MTQKPIKIFLRRSYFRGTAVRLGPTFELKRKLWKKFKFWRFTWNFDSAYPLEIELEILISYYFFIFPQDCLVQNDQTLSSLIDQFCLYIYIDSLSSLSSLLLFVAQNCQSLRITEESIRPKTGSTEKRFHFLKCDSDNSQSSVHLFVVKFICQNAKTSHFSFTLAECKCHYNNG